MPTGAPVASLQDLQSALERYSLAEIMGAENLVLLHLLFPRQLDFQIAKPADKSDPSQTPLTFSATFASLLPWPPPVEAHFCVFDLGSTRQVLFHFQIPAPAPYGVDVYLSQYGLDRDEALDASEDSTPRGPLAELVREIDFGTDAGGKAISFLYSSLDYSAPDSKAAYYPDAFSTIMPREDVRAGLNFRVTAALDDELNGLLADLLGGTVDGKAQWRALVYAGPEGPAFRLSHSDIAAGKAVEKLQLSLTKIELALPLASGTAAWPEIILTGQVKIGNVHFAIVADFDLYTRTLVLAFRDFPTLEDLSGLGAAPDLKEYFPGPLGALLKVKLSALSIALDLTGGCVLGIDLTLSTSSPLTLVSFSAESHVDIAPSLDLRIRAPFQADERTVEGEVTGIWHLGHADFQTSLVFPALDFDIGLQERPDNTLDVDAVIKRVLPDIHDMQRIEITQLECSGNFATRTVTARLSVDGAGTWGFTLAGKQYALDGIYMEVDFANAKFASCELDCHLELAGAHCLLTGQYDATQGLSVAGGTADHDKIDVGDLVNDLMKGLSLPPGCPHPLELTDIVFSATPRSGAYSLSGRTAEPWTLTSGLVLQIDGFSLSKSQDTAVSGLLTASLIVDDETRLQISAAKTGGNDGAWQFEGSASRIPLGTLIAGISRKLGADATVPDALDKLVIDHVGVMFTSAADTRVTFTCEAKYPADGGTADMTLVVEYQRSEKASYSVHFHGTLDVAGQGFHFDLVEVDKGGASSMLLVGTYSSQRPLTLKQLLDGLHGGGADLAPPVSVAIKDALFAYTREGKAPPRYLFGLTVDADLDLADLPGVLGNLGTLGVQDLTVLYASDELSPGQAAAINTELTAAKILPLPMPPAPAQGGAAPGMSKGLSLAATLNLPGGDHVPIVAPRPKAPQTAPRGVAALAAGQPGAPAVPAAGGPSTAAAAADATWFDVQKSLGPLYVDKVGVRYAESRVWFLLTAALRAGGLTLELEGLGLGVNPGKPTDLDVTLAGLDLSVQSGPMSMTGVFLKGEAPVYGRDGRPELEDGKQKTITQFAGEVRIGLPTLSILGVGAYGKLSGDPTLFLYAALSMADGEGIGYPPVVITGLALGFGINYRVVIPPIEEVCTFPLVAMVMGPGGAGAQAGLAPAANADPGAVLRTLLWSDPPTLEVFAGQFFGALGLRFSLFERIDAFALAVVQAGVDLEISLLGLGRLKEPQEGDAVCYIELALLVDIRPAEGVLRVEAQLTANAWVFDPSCRLTGGFALVVWYGGEHRGDFVVSIGGYHPRFLTPAYYPAVPRLGLNLQIGPVVIKGASYLALTPSVIMAGGRLEAVFSDGPIMASFTAYVDFLVQWKPLHYDIGVGVSIHVAADLGLFTIDVSLDVDLLIQGPPFHGVAHVHLGVISFTIGFGGESDAPALIREWSEFATSFLDRTPPAGNDAPAAAGVSAPVPAIHQLHLVGGQITRPGQQNGAGDDEIWFVRADELELAAMSALPASVLVLGQVSPHDPTIAAALAAGNAASGVQRAIDAPLAATHVATQPSQFPLGMRPMGVTALESPLVVSVVDEDNAGRVNNLDRWTVEADRSAMPAAVWDTGALDSTAAPDAKTVPGCVVGMRRLRPPTGGPRGEKIGGVTPEALSYFPLPDRPVAEKPGPQAAPGQAWDTIPRVQGDATRRQRIAAALAQAGFAEAAGFGTQVPISRPLDAVPLSSVLTGGGA